jgi:hypothetical protein
MGFKIRGGRKIPESKWIFNPDENARTSISEDLNGGQVVQLIVRSIDGSWEAQVRHHGIQKWTTEAVLLSEELKAHLTADAAKSWCRKRSRALIIRHDDEVTTKPGEYRVLSRQTTPGALAPGAVEDFGPSQKAMERFRARRRKK